MTDRHLDSSEIDENIIIEVTEEDSQKYRRIDQLLSDKISTLSRSLIKKLYEKNLITNEDEGPLALKKSPKTGQRILVQVPPPIPIEAEPENIPLEILYEDEHLVIVNKQAGMVTHPAPGNYNGTLVNAVLYHCPDLKRIGEKKRPGIVHRLDKGTSGVMVVAKSQACHEGLILLFSTHDIERYYEALVPGFIVPVSGKLESTIGRSPHQRQKMAVNVPRGKHAITHYKVLKEYKEFSHIQLKLETGRTHQIRVHLSSILKRPILCDGTYGQAKTHLNKLSQDYKNILNDYPYPLLHAKTLGFIHPITGESLSFTTAPPAPFSEILELANNEIL